MIALTFFANFTAAKDEKYFISFLEGKVAVYKKIHIYIAPNNISNTIELQRLSAVSLMRLLFLHSKSFLLFPHTRSRAA